MDGPVVPSWSLAIEGVYGWILSIKDLASRCQLLWEPLPVANADVVGTLYERLFQKHGAPLVMKADNGSQFPLSMYYS